MKIQILIFLGCLILGFVFFNLLKTSNKIKLKVEKSVENTEVLNVDKLPVGQSKKDENFSFEEWKQKVKEVAISKEDKLLGSYFGNDKISQNILLLLQGSRYSEIFPNTNEISLKFLENMRLNPVANREIVDSIIKKIPNREFSFEKAALLNVYTNLETDSIKVSSYAKELFYENLNEETEIEHLEQNIFLQVVYELAIKDASIDEAFKITSSLLVIASIKMTSFSPMVCDNFPVFPLVCAIL